MSRSGYSEDVDNWALICYRGAVESAIRGKRGQRLLRDMLAALDAMPVKELIAEDLERDGRVCALGALGNARGMDMTEIDPYDSATVASRFDIAESLAREIAFVNDDDYFDCRHPTPAQRWQRVRNWVIAALRAKEGS